jgi:hypothetical protein
VVELRGKVRALRGEAEGRERQLELAHRTIERLARAKSELEVRPCGVGWDWEVGVGLQHEAACMNY